MTLLELMLECACLNQSTGDAVNVAGVGSSGRQFD